MVIKNNVLSWFRKIVEKTGDRSKIEPIPVLAQTLDTMPITFAKMGLQPSFKLQYGLYGSCSFSPRGVLNDGPAGRSLYCLNLNCRAPPGWLLQPDLTGWWWDVWPNSYADSTCFALYQVLLPCTRYVFYVGIRMYEYFASAFWMYEYFDSDVWIYCLY